MCRLSRYTMVAMIVLLSAFAKISVAEDLSSLQKATQTIIK